MAIANIKWILDDGPLGALAQCVEPDQAATWPRDHFWVPNSCAIAATQDKSGRRLQWLIEHGGPFQSTALDEFGLELLYTHLRPSQSTTVDLGEHEAIAWGLTVSPEAVFVVCDKRAAVLALAELGRHRVCHPFEFWRVLADDGLINRERLRGLCQYSLRADMGLPGIPWGMRQRFES